MAKKQKLNWTLTSLIAGIVGSIIVYILLPYWKLALISGVIIFLLTLAYNPQRVFILAFAKIFWILVLFNQPYYEFKGQIAGLSFKVGNSPIGSTASICLMTLAGLTLILHFLFNKSLKGSFINNEKSNTITNSKNINTEKVNTKGGNFRIGDNN